MSDNIALLDFQIWSDDNDQHGQRLTIVVSEVCSILETITRRSYGGYSEVSYLRLKSGESYKVVGHVADRIRKAGER